MNNLTKLFLLAIVTLHTPTKQLFLVSGGKTRKEKTELQS